MGRIVMFAICLAACGSAGGDAPPPAESCNGLDDDSDGRIDEEPSDGTMYFVDADGDTWGAEIRACERPATTVDRGGDCRDDNAMAYPGSTATVVPLDGVDMDCDGNDFCTDLNCDGRADVVVPSHHDGDYNITQAARLLSGAGGWSLEATPITMHGTLGVAVADLDKDGYQDIVHASYHDGTSHNANSFIYWGGSNHGQAQRMGLPTHGAHWVCIADFDNNGWSDVLFANHFNGTSYATNSYVYRNRPGNFAPLDRIVLASNGATHCAVDDLNADGHLDIVLTNYYNGSYSTMSHIYWGSAAADYSMRTDLPTIGARTATIVDVDKDGTKDIVFWSHYNGTNYQTNENYIYWNRGGFSQSNRTQLASNGGFRGAVADLNKDGFNDIIAAGYHNNGWANVAPTYIYWGNAQAMYTAANRTTISTRGVLDAIVDDINNDGHQDILLPAHYDGDSFAPSTIMWGTAGGTYSDGNRLELPGYHVTHGAAVADFNRDGHKDVFLPGYHNNATGMDATPWANQAYSRIYWGSASGLRATFFDQWPTRGAWSAVVVGR